MRKYLQSTKPLIILYFVLCRTRNVSFICGVIEIELVQQKKRKDI